MSLVPKTLCLAFNYHDENDELKFVQLEAGDDAVNVKWVEVNGLKLFFKFLCFKISDRVKSQPKFKTLRLS